MNVTRFRGSTVALVTPFETGGGVDEDRLRKLVDWHIEQGTNVILAMGTTGESATLSHEEHQQVMAIIVEQVDRRIPVLCGAGSNATSEAIDLTRHAAQIGGDAILSVAPYYNKPTQEGFFQHFKAIAESTDLPVFIYNVPGRTGSNITAGTTLRLAEIPNIGGVKEASGDLSQIMAILRSRPQDFLVLAGDDAFAFPVMALGGDGVVSVVANETPRLLSQMVAAALNAQWEEARRLHYRLLPLMEANFIESNPIPVKAAMAMMGLLEENYRLPMVPMSDQNRQTLRKVLEEADLLEGRR